MSETAPIRLFVDTPLPGPGTHGLTGDQAHYVIHVMRRRTGDRLALFNGRDGEWLAEITATAKRAVTLAVTRQTRPQKAEPDVWIAFAPIKKARTDFIAQKVTELGAARLMPVMTRRTVADRVNTARMHANAVEAAEQCERLTVPQVDAPVKLDALLAAWPQDRRLLFCDEDLTGTPILAALMAPKAPKAPKATALPVVTDDGGDAGESASLPPSVTASVTSSWGLLIGPEGGFDDTERARIRAVAGAIPVTLGPRLLRADTAALAALAIWQAALGDWAPDN